MKSQNILSFMLLLSVVLLTMTVLSYVLVLPSQIPLFYSLGRLQDQIIHKAYIFILPALAFGFLFTSLFFQRVIEDEVIKILISYVNLFLIVLLYIVFIRTIFLVT